MVFWLLLVTLNPSVNVTDWAHSAIRIVIPSRTAVTDASFEPGNRVLTGNANAFQGYTFVPGDTFLVTEAKGYYLEDLNPGLLRAYRIEERLSDSSIRLESIIRSPDAIPGGAGIYIYHLKGKLQREATAEMLKTYLSESLPNATVDIDTSCLASGINVHLGQSQCGMTAISLIDLDDEGYVLKGLDDANHVIAGPTEEGTENGTYEFLERHLGVRWVMPDSHFTSAELAQIEPAPVDAPADGAGKYLVRGDHVPVHTILTIPQTEVRESPAYLTRAGSGYGFSSNGVISTQRQWTRKLRGNSRVDPSHNTHRLFPPSIYGGSHPEFYPDQLIPVYDYQTDWFPNFSASALAAAAADRLKMYFDDNQEAASFPIGLEDTGPATKRDTSVASFAREPVAEGCTTNPPADCTTRVAFNSIGLRDMSWSYFQWANEAVALLRGPSYSGYGNNKYLGALAYDETFDPPDRDTRDGRAGFGPLGPMVDDHVIPFFAFERLKLVDDRAGVGQRARYEALLGRWANVTSGDLGAYDYLASALAPVPHLSEISRYLQSDYNAGVRHSRSEHYPNWGEAFKFYAYFKLLWKPDLKIFDDQNGPGLLTDWCTAAVGPEAASHLVEFYTDWDDFWSGVDGAGARSLNYLRYARGSFVSVIATEYLDHPTVAQLLEHSAQTLDDCVAAATAPGSSATTHQKNRAWLMRAQYGYWAITGQARRAATLAHTEALAGQVVEAAGVLQDSIVAEQDRMDWVKPWPLDNTHGNDHIMGVAGGIPKHYLFDLMGKWWDRDLMFRLLAMKDDAAVTSTINSIDPAAYPDLVTELSISKSVWNHLCQAPAMTPLNADPGFSNTSLNDHWRTSVADGVSNPFSVVDDPASGSNQGKVVKIAGASGSESYIYQSVSNLSYATTADYILFVRVYADTPPTRGTVYIQAPARTNISLAGVFVVGRGLVEIHPISGEWITVACPVRLPPTTQDIGMFLVMRDMPDDEPDYAIYVDDFQLQRVDVAAPLLGPLSAGATSVTVSGVDADAANVTLYKNGAQLGPPVVPNGNNSVIFNNLALSPGDVVYAVMQSTEGVPYQTREMIVPCPDDADGDGIADCIDLCPTTPAGNPPGLSGCPPLRFDFDLNGRVDEDDYDQFKLCVTGPTIFGPPATGCTAAQFAACDVDNDGDGDLDDYGAFQRCYSGAGNYDPHCAD